MNKKIHFIGIGGIGMSALARYYLNLGWQVSGSDISDSQLVKDLISEGVEIKVGEQVKENLPENVDRVIYTIAVKENNSELLAARENRTELMTYPEALGEMTKSKKTIAVCGTHGKTTTTAMVFTMLKECGLEPSMILGSLIDWQGRKTNYVYGESDWLVIEACEYKKSFLNYFPDYTIVTNIDADHLDFYKDLEEIKKSFGEFLDNIKDGGKIIIRPQENYLAEFSQKLAYDKIQKILVSDFLTEEEMNTKLVLSIPGRHNRENASLAFTLGKILGLEESKILSGLQKFKGTWRRQEYKGILTTKAGNKIIFYDDYAHHPYEIKATLLAFREKYPNQKIYVAFMPHLFSRTKLLFSDFIKELSNADKVFLLPIYKAREEVDPNISSEKLAEAINQKLNMPIAEVTPDFPELKREILNINTDCIFLTMGAGNIDEIYQILNLEK